MKTDVLNTRQLCFLLAIFCPLGKIILLPSLLAERTGADLLLCAAALFLAEGISVFFALWCLSRRDDTLLELWTEKTNAPFARIILCVLGVFLVFASLVPVIEHKQYVQNVMYDVLPSVIVFLPFFLFSAYACGKRLQCAGRAADVALPVAAVGFGALLFMSVASADFTELLPVGRSGATAFFGGMARGSIWFSSGAWVLLLQGKVQKSKGFLWKTTLSYGVGALLALFFFAVFYGIFSSVAPNEPFAVSKIARYYGALKTLGRVDYLFLYLLMLAQLFALVFPLQLATQALAEGCNCTNLAPFSVGVNAAVLAVMLLTAKNFPSMLEFFGAKLFWVFFLFAFLLPVLSPLLTLQKGGVSHAKK